MRTLIASLVLITTLVGCASKPTVTQRPIPPKTEYGERGAGALVFTPAVAQGEPAVVLARGPREPSVFIGFDEISATSFYIRTEDRQADDMSDRYMRRSVIERVGVTYR
jgi:hypothetical protein